MLHRIPHRLSRWAARFGQAVAFSTILASAPAAAATISGAFSNFGSQAPSAGCTALGFRIELDGSGAREELDFVFANTCQSNRSTRVLVDVSNLEQFGMLELSDALQAGLDGRLDAGERVQTGSRVVSRFSLSFTDNGRAPNFGVLSVTVAQVPVPAALPLLSTGLLIGGLFRAGRRRRNGGVRA